MHARRAIVNGVDDGSTSMGGAGVSAAGAAALAAGAGATTGGGPLQHEIPALIAALTAVPNLARCTR